MLKTILGIKQNMSSLYNRQGNHIPVTYIVADSNVVVGLKEGRIVLGFGQKKKAKKTENGQVKAVGYSPKVIKEINITQDQSPQEKKISIGDKISVSIFAPGDLVKVSGITRGKGFAGAVKRWGFAGGPKTHGQSDRHRAPGSIGAGTDPGRVWKGKKMAGHMGASKLTVTNLEVIEVDEGKNLIAVKGSVPGTKDRLLIIEKTGKAKISKEPVLSQLPKVSENKSEEEVNDNA